MNSYKNMAAMLFLLICAGCVEETSFEPSGHHAKTNEPSFTLEDVQRYFDANVNSFYISPEGPTRNPDEDLLTMPLWDKGEIRQLDDEFIAEVPVMAPVTIMSTLYVHNDSVMIAQYPYMNTGYNLIAQKGADDTFLFTIARITGDPDYLIDRHKQKKEGLTVADKEHFCGSIRYFTLEGEFLYGEIFEDGKRTATIAQHLNIVPGTAEADSILHKFKEKKIRADSLLHFKTRGWETYCEWIPYWVSELVCTGVYINENYMENCEYSDVRGHYEYEEVCQDIYVPDPTNPNISGGSDGGNDGKGDKGETETGNDYREQDTEDPKITQAKNTIADLVIQYQNLTNEQLILIADVINQFKNFPPLETIFSVFSNEGMRVLGITFNESLYWDNKPENLRVSYSPSLNTFNFKENEDLNLKTFTHEYIHFLQYSLMGSEANMENRGMMEAERTIILDMICAQMHYTMGRNAFGPWEQSLVLSDSNCNEEWANNYNRIIEDIKKNGKYYKYNSLMNKETASKQDSESLVSR